MPVGAQAGVGVGAKAPAPTGHSRFGASGADRWIECPGSVVAQEGLPNITTIYAAEGTAGHEVGALCLQNKQDAIEYVDRTITVDGFDIEFGEDLCDAVQVYLDAIRDDQKERGGKIVIERRFHLEWLDKEFFGTSDCGRLGTDRTLSVYDLKLGKGKAVDVVTFDALGAAAPNRQLCYYALGMIASLPKTLQIDNVELVIVQPRRKHKDGPVRRFTLPVNDLLGYCQDLVDAANNARSEFPTFKAGDHCGFCRAAGKCRAFRDRAMDAAQVDFDDDVSAIGDNLKKAEDMDTADLLKALDAADVLQMWGASVRAYADAMTAAGRLELPGWKRVDKRATRKWLAEDTANTASALCFDFGLDESSIFVQKLKSPTQIEKLLPKADRKNLESFYSKTSSGTKLVREDDTRDARAPSAQTDFDD